MTYENIIQLVRHGVTLDITSNVSLELDSLKSLIIIAVENDGHVIIDARKYKSENLQNFAKIGGRHLTIKF
jgi:hypothetical protein